MEECQYLDEELDGLVAEIQEKFDDLKKTDKKLTASARTDKVEFQPRQHQLTLTPTLTLALVLTLTLTLTLTRNTTMSPHLFHFPQRSNHSLDVLLLNLPRRVRDVTCPAALDSWSPHPNTQIDYIQDRIARAKDVLANFRGGCQPRSPSKAPIYFPLCSKHIGCWALNRATRVSTRSGAAGGAKRRREAGTCRAGGCESKHQTPLCRSRIHG